MTRYLVKLTASDVGCGGSAFDMAHFSIRRSPEATDDSEALSSSSDQVVVVVVVGKAKASDAEARSTDAPATNRQ
jgi:hypothetical protein